MKINLNSYLAAFSALPETVCEAEVCADLREELLIRIYVGVQTGGESFSRTTLYLRASGEKTGTILTERLDEDPYQLIQKTVNNASCSQTEGLEPIAKGNSLRIISGDDSANYFELLNTACHLEKIALKLKGISCIENCSIRKTIYARRVVNSKGMDRYLEHTGYLATLSLRAKRKGNKEPLGKSEQYAPTLSDLNLSLLAEHALENANRMDANGTLTRTSLPSGTYKAILSTEVTRNIMITAWMAFSAERMKNGSSFLSLADVDIASPLVTIVDNPLPPDWSVNYSLDSEGIICTKHDVVRCGKLLSPLSTLSSTKSTSCNSTGNAGRVAGLSGTTPINLTTIPSCIYIKAGASSFADMVEQMGDGLYLTYSLDVFHSINIASGEFSIPCGGIVFKKGKPVGTVEQLTIAGNLRDLFKNIKAVGSDLTLEEFMFYHNYSYGGPSLLVDNLTFSSKQS